MNIDPRSRNPRVLPPSTMFEKARKKKPSPIVTADDSRCPLAGSFFWTFTRECAESTEEGGTLARNRSPLIQVFDTVDSAQTRQKRSTSRIVQLDLI